MIKVRLLRVWAIALVASRRVPAFGWWLAGVGSQLAFILVNANGGAVEVWVLVSSVASTTLAKVPGKKVAHKFPPSSTAENTLIFPTILIFPTWYTYHPGLLTHFDCAEHLWHWPLWCVWHCCWHSSTSSWQWSPVQPEAQEHTPGETQRPPFSQPPRQTATIGRISCQSHFQ